MNRTILKWIVYGGMFIVPFIPFFVSGALFFPFITTKGFAFRIIVEVVGAAWLLLIMLEPELRPKKSPLLWTILSFLLIVGIADIFGVAPVKSFWSNFERMEGFITLLHLGLYFLIVGTVLDEIDWRRWWKTSLFASLGLVVYSLFQMAGALDIHQGGARVDATLGNAEYLAVYMLVHVFIALFYYMREKNVWWKWFFGIAALGDVFVIYESATRGAILGLLGGLLIAAVLNLTNKQSARMRRASQGYVALFILIILGFFAFRTTNFVKNNPTLGRFASINATELAGEGRSFVWPMALEGIKERPILGWGQDNFNYVFNEHYSPEMFRLEPWFDRAHNIFLDWGVSAGILGLLAYLSLYAAFIWIVWKKDEHFTRAERSILTGLLAAYFFNNFFVFDNLVSYILFFSLLAYIYMREPRSKHQTASFKFTESTVLSIALPSVVIVFAVVFYFVDVRPLETNTLLIDGLSAVQANVDMKPAVEDLEAAYGESRLGRPEVSEQIGANASAILGSSSLTTDQKNAFYAFATKAVTEQADEYPTDTRYQLLAGSFLADSGSVDQGIVYLKKALALTPGKQAIYTELGAAYLNKGDYPDALATFKTSYELDTDDTEAEITYFAGAVFAGDTQTEMKLRADLETPAKESSLLDTRILTTYVQKKRYQDLIGYLTEVGNKFPDLKAQADQYITQVRALGQ